MCKAFETAIAMYKAMIASLPPILDTILVLNDNEDDVQDLLDLLFLRRIFRYMSEAFLPRDSVKVVMDRASEPIEQLCQPPPSYTSTNPPVILID